MSSQIDWVSPVTTPRPFKDIRNQRESVAEEEARLLLELGRLMRKAPASVNAGSVQKVRMWVAAVKSAQKVAGSARSSVPDISRAISILMREGGES